MEAVRRATDNHRPLQGIGNGPERVAAGRKWMALYKYVAAELDRGGRIGARVPDAPPAHNPSEQPASTRDRTVVTDADVRHTDALGDGAVLAEGDALGRRSTRACGREDQRAEHHG